MYLQFLNYFLHYLENCEVEKFHILVNFLRCIIPKNSKNFRIFCSISIFCFNFFKNVFFFGLFGVLKAENWRKSAKKFFYEFSV